MVEEQEEMKTVIKTSELLLSEKPEGFFLNLQLSKYWSHAACLF